RFDNTLNFSSARLHPVIDHKDQPVHPTQTINKRARTLTYDNAVCTGAKLYQDILEAFDGRKDPGHEFSDDDLEIGWSEVDQERVVDAGWDAAFRTIGRNLSIGDRGPFEDEIEHTNLMLLQDFKNAAGETVTPTDIEKEAQYEIAYIDKFRAILALEVHSPRHQVTASLRAANQPITKEAIDKRIPPLNRFSDFMWTGWNAITLLPVSLRYVLHDTITNADTVGIMVDIINKHAITGSIDWPGLTFGIDTEEGQALLGTPNGFGTAFLLIDRARELGRRIVYVTIFNPGGDYRMLWDMKPPNAPR
ncbi:MAG: hypothetical protein Q9184_008224, partial [Pyrenodesmia sp. 2 TL-2023]